MNVTGLAVVVRRLRRELDLTQEDLAKEIGFSTTTVSRLEAGKHQVSRVLLERLAKALRVPVTQLEDVASPTVQRKEIERGASDLTSWGEDFWAPYVDSSADSGLDRLAKFAPESAQQLGDQMNELGEGLYSLSKELRELTHHSELSNTIPILRMAITMLILAKSNRVPILQAALGSMIYIRASTSQTRETSIVARFKEVKEALHEFSNAFEHLNKEDLPSLEHAWARFWILRELASISRAMLEFALRAQDEPSPKAGRGSGLLEAAKRDGVTFIGVVGMLPALPEWVLQLLPEGRVATMVYSRNQNPEAILQISVVLERATQALKLYLTAEQYAARWSGNIARQHPDWTDQCLLARWKVDLANVVRDRLLVATDLQAWARLRHRTPFVTSKEAISGSLIDCEAEIRESILFLREATKLKSGADRKLGVKTLAWQHLELGFLIRVSGDFQRYREAIWNQIVSCSLDPMRMAKVNRQTATLLAEIESELRPSEFSALMDDLEQRRDNTDFEALDYQF